MIAGLRERGDKEAADAVERANSERAAGLRGAGRGSRGAGG